VRKLRGSDVTVVIPTIPGRHELLDRAIASVHNQDIPVRHIVTVLDEDRRGAAWARTEGMRMVDTDVIAWLDDDDRLKSNHVRVLLAALNRTGHGMAFSYATFIGGRDPLAVCQNGQLIKEPLMVPFDQEQRWHLDSRAHEYCPSCHYLTGNFIPITYLVRTELALRAGGFPEPHSMPGVRTSGECEDYLFLLRMLDVGGWFTHVPARTWDYFIHGRNTGGRGADRMHELEGTP
jgi:glycosyltransferase involved in cell wall biosynthesis